MFIPESWEYKKNGNVRPRFLGMLGLEKQECLNIPDSWEWKKTPGMLITDFSERSGWKKTGNVYPGLPGMLGLQKTWECSSQIPGNAKRPRNV